MFLHLKCFYANFSGFFHENVFILANVTVLTYFKAQTLIFKTNDVRAFYVDWKSNSERKSSDKTLFSNIFELNLQYVIDRFWVFRNGFICFYHKIHWFIGYSEFNEKTLMVINYSFPWTSIGKEYTLAVQLFQLINLIRHHITQQPLHHQKYQE